MTWTHAASLDDARAAQPWLPLTIGTLDIAVASADGTFYGVEDRCSHAGCAFSEDADLEGSEVICNCHGSEFDLRSGEVRRGPAERPIRTFPVRIVGDQLEIDV